MIWQRDFVRMVLKWHVSMVAHVTTSSRERDLDCTRCAFFAHSFKFDVIINDTERMIHYSRFPCERKTLESACRILVVIQLKRESTTHMRSTHPLQFAHFKTLRVINVTMRINSISGPVVRRVNSAIHRIKLSTT